MKFSVIMPSKDGEKRINKALNSIISQSFKDYEMIVICDSCEDNTKQVAESYGAITLECEHKSPGLTLNEGLKIAQGEYILFMNDDDWFLHERVFELIDNQLNQIHADILCFGFIMGKLGYKTALGNNGKLFPGQTLKAWRRSTIGETQFIKDPVYCDLVFLEDVISKNPIVATWDEPLYYHDWMRPGSITEVSKCQ